MATTYRNSNNGQSGHASAGQVRTRLVDVSLVLAGAAVFGLGVISTQIGQVKRRIQGLQHRSGHTHHSA